MKSKGDTKQKDLSKQAKPSTWLNVNLWYFLFTYKGKFKIGLEKPY